MATTIKEILDKLPEDDRRLLEYCFSADIPNFVVLKDGRFVGVFCEKIPQCSDIQLEAGSWRVGKIKE